MGPPLDERKKAIRNNNNEQIPYIFHVEFISFMCMIALSILPRLKCIYRQKKLASPGNMLVWSISYNFVLYC